MPLEYVGVISKKMGCNNTVESGAEMYRVTFYGINLGIVNQKVDPVPISLFE